MSTSVPIGSLCLWTIYQSFNVQISLLCLIIKTMNLTMIPGIYIAMFIMYKIHSSFINLDYGYMIMNVLGDKDH
jgi:hypothetical protein